MNQHDYIQGCLAYYKANDIQVGDPHEGDWEEAHYPTPKWAGGTETVLLLHDHHQIQGVLQSVEFSRPCFWLADVRKSLSTFWPTGWFELMETAERLHRKQASENGLKEHARGAGIHGFSTEQRRAIGKRVASRQLWSEASRQKLSRSMTGHPVSEATREKIRKTNTGKKHTAQSLHNLRKAMANPETRARMSQAQKGHAVSDQTKRLLKRRHNERWLSLTSGYFNTKSWVARSGFGNEPMALVPDALIEHMSKDRDANLTIWTAYQQNPGLLQ